MTRLVVVFNFYRIEAVYYSLSTTKGACCTYVTRPGRSQAINTKLLILSLLNVLSINELYYSLPTTFDYIQPVFKSELGTIISAVFLLDRRPTNRIEAIQGITK